MQSGHLNSEGMGLGSLGLSSTFFGAPSVGRATIFRSDDYIERLNQQLRFELGVVHTYSRLADSPLDRLLALELATAHQKACRELIRMIISHHGLPDDSPASIFKVTGTVIEICTQWSIGQRFLTIPLVNIEQLMTNRYRALIEIAPECDKHVLIELKRLSRRNRSFVRKFKNNLKGS